MKECDVTLLQSQLYLTDGYYRSVTNCNLQVGISEISNDNDVQLFPNPSSGYIIVKTKKRISYDIYTLTGIKLKSGEVSSDDKININELASGIYLFRFFDEENNIQTVKIIKNY